MKENNVIIYVVLNDALCDFVTSEQCDPAEQAGIIDRTLLSVRDTGKGWADSRRSSYTVTGQIKSESSKFTLFDENVPIAVLGVCLASDSSLNLWQWLNSNAVTLLPEMDGPPTGAWAGLRYDVSETALPPWIDWWAKHVAFALLGRESW